MENNNEKEDMNEELIKLKEKEDELNQLLKENSELIKITEEACQESSEEPVSKNCEESPEEI